MTITGLLAGLSRLDAAQGRAERPVARCRRSTHDSGRDVTWDELRHDVARLRARLEDDRATAWVLLTEDAYAFAVGLFAVWHAGHHAVLPPNRQPQALERLQTRASGVISDRADWIPDGGVLHPLRDGRDDTARDLGVLDREAPAVELFTSGTTSDEKPVTKQLKHLEDEVVQLESTWGDTVRGATFFSTTSHQHLYGLLFGVLWPLCAGHRFDAHHYLHAGELVPRMRSEPSSVLASVPTSLRHLVRHRETAELASRCRAVFSSGGPLAAETAWAARDVLGRAPIEVLGSTETGGIAWRSQHRDEPAPWTPFPSVRIEQDAHSDMLRVASPLVSVETSKGGYSTGDRITLHADGRFDLRGRADQVVKIGEKRLDLTSMASQLRGHAWIDEVALTTIDRQSEERVAAVIVASSRGRTVLENDGRRAFSNGLREWLGDSWDPVLHPRHWRIVEALPENTQGKVTKRALADLFRGDDPRSDDATENGRDRPQVLEEVRGEDWIERTGAVPHHLACLEGHFPGDPVVPGVLQLDWAMDAAAALLGSRPAVEEIETLKLLAPLRPGMRFTLHVKAIRRGADGQPGGGVTKLELLLQRGDEKHAVGRVRLRDPVGEPSTRARPEADREDGR